MWTKRSWACFGVSAVAVFGLTLAVGWPNGATAGDEQGWLTGTNVQPSLLSNGISVKAQFIGDQHALQLNGPVQLVRPGMLGKMELVVTNNGTVAATARFAATTLVSRMPDTMSRVAMPTNTIPTASQRYDMVLAPGESRLLDVDTVPTLTPMTLTTLKLEADGSRIDALTLAATASPEKIQLTTSAKP